MPTIRPRIEIELDAAWKRLPAGTAWLIALACAVTLAVVIVGPSLLWEYAGSIYAGRREVDLVDEFWFRDGLAIGFVFWIAVSYAAGSTGSRALHVAVLLAVAHGAAIVAIGVLWPALARQMPGAATASPLVSALPVSAVAAVAGAACVAGGAAVARRRSGDWVHATAMLALANLLLVGLWLPVVCRIRADAILRTDGMSSDLWFVTRGSMIATVLVPPFVAALAYTAIAIRRPAWTRRHRVALACAAALLFAAAFAVRIDPAFRPAAIYVNFVHVLLALAAVAVGALALLGTALALRERRTWRRAAADPSPIAGRVALDDGVPTVAYTEITSWLRGPDRRFRPITVATARGAIHIPSGAALIAPTHLATARLEVGEAIEELRCGDRVTVTGLVEPPAGHPFRDASALLPGPYVAIARDDAAPGGFASLVLAVWRPCLVYLLVVIAIAIPGLVGAFGGNVTVRHLW